jgi:DNA-directed RNA polymerase
MSIRSGRLKVHLANVFGNDKITFADRVRFVENNMEHIADSAANPLGGQRWWLKADKPWQCLAASIELMNAYNSGSPQSYVSTLPIHQDGSCNGLQHYAALGGDEMGARQVNLLPSERPQDVYSGVVELVVRRLEDDAANGVEIAQKLIGKVDRKVIKQTVMTRCVRGICHSPHALVLLVKLTDPLFVASITVYTALPSSERGSRSKTR